MQVRLGQTFRPVQNSFQRNQAQPRFGKDSGGKGDEEDIFARGPEEDTPEVEAFRLALAADWVDDPNVSPERRQAAQGVLDESWKKDGH